MFIQIVKPVQKDKDGFFCYLMRAYRENGKPKNERVYSFGFVASEKVPYLKAALDEGDPAEIFERTKEWVEARRPKMTKESPGGKNKE